MKTSTAALIGLGLFGGAAIAYELTKTRYTFAGKHAVITGGSRGLGLALARELTLRGAKVSLISRDESQLARAVQDLNQRGGDAAAFAADLTENAFDGHGDANDPLVQLVAKIAQERGPIDVLVNNAGTIAVGPFQAMGVDQLKQVMVINFLAAARMTFAIAPQMAQRGGGKIINVASVGGKMPVPHLPAYCASKFALNGFFGSARADLRRDGITVTTVNPGLMQTGSTGNALVQGDHEKEYAWFTLGDSLPGLSMPAAKAARRIIDAAAEGRAEVTIGLPAKVASKLYGLAPNLTHALNTLTAMMLPKGANPEVRRGNEVESTVTRSPLTTLTQKARVNLNQM